MELEDTRYLFAMNAGKRGTFRKIDRFPAVGTTKSASIKSIKDPNETEVDDTRELTGISKKNEVLKSQKKNEIVIRRTKTVTVNVQMQGGSGS